MEDFLGLLQQSVFRRYNKTLLLVALEIPRTSQFFLEKATTRIPSCKILRLVREKSE